MIGGNFIIIGIIVIFVGIFLVIIGSILGVKTDSKFGFGGFIGPIPFGFGNDPKLVWIAIGISVVIFLIMIFGGKIF